METPPGISGTESLWSILDQDEYWRTSEVYPDTPTEADMVWKRVTDLDLEHKVSIMGWLLRNARKVVGQHINNIERIMLTIPSDTDAQDDLLWQIEGEVRKLSGMTGDEIRLEIMGKPMFRRLLVDVVEASGQRVVGARRLLELETTEASVKHLAGVR